MTIADPWHVFYPTVGTLDLVGVHRTSADELAAILPQNRANGILNVGDRHAATEEDLTRLPASVIVPSGAR